MVKRKSRGQGDQSPISVTEDDGNALQDKIDTATSLPSKDTTAFAMQKTTDAIGKGVIHHQASPSTDNATSERRLDPPKADIRTSVRTSPAINSTPPATPQKDRRLAPPKVAIRTDARTSPSINSTSPATPPKVQRVEKVPNSTPPRQYRPVQKRSELRMSKNTVHIFVLTKMVSFVQHNGVVTKMWIVVIPSGEHVVLHLEDCAHDLYTHYGSLVQFGYAKLDGVSSKKTPNRNCVFLRICASERRMYYNMPMTSLNIVELDEADHFDVPSLLPYNEISAATSGDSRLHETLVFAVVNAAINVHFDRHNRISTR